MPEAWDEFTADELAAVLGASKYDAAALLDLAHNLAVKLPGTRTALRDGTLNVKKAAIISWATELLDPEEARAAEALVLDRAGQLSPGALRSAITRAVMEIAADKARKRREQAAKKARVERWAEYSGNAALVGRELPPAEVLAADQRVSWWARQLHRAGLDGSMDELRAKAYIDLLLGTDSRPSRDAEGGQHNATPDSHTSDSAAQDSHTPDSAAQDSHTRDSHTRDSHTGDSDADDRARNSRQGGAGGQGGMSGPEDGPAESSAAGRPVSAVPAGFAGRVNLTVPLATLLGLAHRPGEIPGIGPVDPWLARDLAAVAAQNPKTTWCMTVTNAQGQAVGHGCARPEPGNHRKQHAKRDKRGPRDGGDPPREAGNRDRPGFAFTAAGQRGPPGGYGAWHLSTGTPGRPGLLITLEPIAFDECDHRLAAKGHDPGAKLRHLAGVRHATCTGPGCRRPAKQCDFEHNIPYEAGGLSCLCNGGPKCRHDHRLKQDRRWKVEQVTPATFRWTTPSGRQYITEPTRYPI